MSKKFDPLLRAFDPTNSTEDFVAEITAKNLFYEPDESDVAEIIRCLRQCQPVQTGNRRLTPAKIAEAVAIIENFVSGSLSVRFTGTNCSKPTVAVALLCRIYNCSLMPQGGTSLCGPFAFLYELAAHDPAIYARFVVDVLTQPNVILGTRGGASSLALDIPADFAAQFVGERGTAVDFIPAACLRNFSLTLQYDSNAHSMEHGYTTPAQMTEWMRNAGFSDVIDRTVLDAAPGGVQAVSKIPSAHQPQAVEHNLAGYRGPNAYVERFLTTHLTDGEHQQYFKKKLNNLSHAQLKLSQGFVSLYFATPSLLTIWKILDSRRPTSPDTAGIGHRSYTALSISRAVRT